MSRPLRIQYPGAWYHVMNRGRRRERVFFDQKDFERFISLLQEAGNLWNCRVAAYCLMSNHYHILLQTPDANINRIMRHINGVYTQHFNRRHGLDGSLFRGRYKSILIDADNYLLELIRYIHRNPLHAGIEKKLGEYPWTSHSGYVSEAKKWAWLYKDFPLAMLSRKKSGRIKAYLDFVASPVSQKINLFFNEKKLNPVLGKDNFVKWVKEKFSDKKNTKEIPEAKHLYHDPDTIKNLVCDHYGIEKGMLNATKRGTSNVPRSVAIYILRTQGGKTLIEIGHIFSIDSYSSVSSAIQRLKVAMTKDKKLEKQVSTIISKLDKSQEQT